MLMTMKHFKKTKPKKTKEMLVRVLVCIAISPFVFSLGYAALMLAMIGMWKLGNLLGDNGQMLPYSLFTLVFIALWARWEFRASKKKYLEYLITQTSIQLLEMISAPAGLYSKREIEFARNVLQEREIPLTSQ